MANHKYQVKRISDDNPSTAARLFEDYLNSISDNYMLDSWQYCPKVSYPSGGFSKVTYIVLLKEKPIELPVEVSYGSRKFKGDI